MLQPTASQNALKKTLRNAFGAASLWAAGLLLMACGGGDLVSLVPGVGTGGTGSTAGTVTGLGSVIVDGVRYDDSAAVLERQADLLQSETLSLADLQVGQYVYLDLDANGTPTRVRLEAQLVGPVGSVTAASGQLTVWGQTITINSDPGAGPVTLFSGYTSLADMRPQDRVQVYGVLQNTANDAGHDTLRATRIERLVSASTLPARLTGLLRNNGSAGLQLAGLPLDTSGLSQTASSTVLQAGQWVTVVLPWPADPDTAPSRWQALGLRVLSQTDSTASRLRLSGAVQLRSDGLLSVQGVKVDASAAALASIYAQLVPGSYITVAGTLDHSSGKLLASSIELTPAGGRVMELHGSVTSVLDPGRFMLRGIQVNTDDARWLGGTAAELINGRYVEVTGHLVNNLFRADTVKLQTGLPDRAVLDVTAVVQSVNSSTRLVQVLAQDQQTLTIAFAASAPLPAVGDTIRVEGYWADNLLQARDISSQPPLDRDLIRLEGIVDGSSPGQFSLNGVLVRVDAALFPTLQISAGDRLQVEVKRIDGQYWLARFESRPPRR